MIALFPVVFSSMMLILLHVAALRFASMIALSLALMTSVSWNLGLWWLGRRRVVR